MIDQDELERRLANWWRWIHQRETATDIAPSPTWRLAPRGRRSESTIPLLLGEALDTDGALKRIPKDQAAALVAAYCWTGRRVDQARRLRIRVRRYYDLIAAAEAAFGQALADLRRAARVTG